MTTKLEQLCKANEGKRLVTACDYSHGIYNAVDELAGFVKAYSHGNKALIERALDCFEEDNLEQLCDLACDLERAAYNIHVSGYKLVSSNGSLFYVNLEDYKSEFMED